MPYYFAPLEGVTGTIFRNAHHQYFGGVDQYYMPFLCPTQEHKLTKRHLQELLPENNGATPAVPQLLGKREEDFVWAIKAIGDMGYTEININFGCPSGTVVAKGRGSGMLGDLDHLDRFLEEIFNNTPIPISVKTRLGLKDVGEFSRIMDIYNRFPIKELTIHPRLQQDFYKGMIHMDIFEEALVGCKMPICYNGDLTHLEDVHRFCEQYPSVNGVMIGRGAICNPAIFSQLKGGAPAKKEALQGFSQQVYEQYSISFESRRNAMMRMKEFWRYLIGLFGDREQLAKKMKKVVKPDEYEALVDRIFKELPLLEEAPRRESFLGYF